MSEELSPAINVSLPVTSDEKPLFTDEKIINYYEEAIENLRDDRKEADTMYHTFVDMVMNEDGSTSSKEALVNLLKLKTETNDRMIKILDLWTRLKMKEKNTFPLHLAVQQNNKIDGSRNTRKMIETMMKENNEQD